MLAFSIAALVLLAIAIFMLSYRLWRAPAADDADRAANEAVDSLDILRDQRRELDGEVAAGRMTAEERETRLAELQRRVHDEGLVLPRAASGLTPSRETSGRAANPPRRRAWLAIATSVLVPVLAIPLYLVIGNPGAIDPAPVADADTAKHGEMTSEQVRVLLDQLKARLEKRPDDLEGWTMLGRGLRLVDDFAGSAAAFEKANALSGNDPVILADLADSLGMAQGKSLEGRPSQLIQQALAIDPRLPKALALAASAEFGQGRYPAAKGYWQRLLAVMPPDSEAANEVREILAQLDARIAGGGAQSATGVGSPSAAGNGSQSGAGTRSQSSAGAGSPQSAASAPGRAPGTGSNTSSAGAIGGTVKLAPALAAKVAPGDTLFIFARAVEGPRMPLAIIRATAADLPRAFRLDDTQAMAGGPMLSSIAQVKIEARISKSGEALPKSGDLRGESTIVTPGMSNVEIVIDRVVP